VARMADKRYTCKNLMGKVERKHLKGLCVSGSMIRLAQDRVKWRTLVNPMKLPVP
jgi:hypothetical protein